MTKISRKIFISAAMMLFAVGGVFANPQFITSPQRIATAGQFWSEADLFIDPRGWADLEFNNWFGLVSLDQVNMAQLGFATRFGGLYTALFYSGNAWRVTRHAYTERSDNFFGTPRSMRVYTALPSIPSNHTLYNEFTFLLGIADMGFRVSFASSLQSRRLDELFRAGTNHYRSFHSAFGSINPEIAWGMTRELVPGRGIMPHVYVNMDFFRDFQKYDMFTGADTSTGELINRSNNSATFGITAYMGGFALMAQDNFHLGVDLSYSVALTIFNNEYNFNDANGILRVGNFNGTFNGASLMGQSANSHVITPYLYSSWQGERLALSAELGLTLGFGSERNTGMALRTGSTDGSLVNDGMDRSISFFEFSPTLNLGMQWGIVPQRFFLNAGSHISLGELRLQTTETRTYNQGTEDVNARENVIENDFFGASTILTLGITFNITENLSLQAMNGVDINANTINIFDPTVGQGLGTFSSILVKLRF